MRDSSKSIVKYLLPVVVAILCISGCGRVRTWVVVQVVVKPLPGQTLSAAALSSGEQALRNRASALGVNPSDVEVSRSGYTYTLDIPVATDEITVRKLYQAPGRLEFFHLKNVNDSPMQGSNRSPMWIMDDSGSSYSFTDARKPGAAPITDPLEIRRRVIGARTQPILAGKDLVPGRAKVEYGQGSNVVVSLELSPQAKMRLAQFTRTHVKEYLAITLDDRILTAPIIQESIPGNPIISGNFTVARAQDLANILNGGELPFQPKVQSVFVRKGSAGVKRP